MLGLFNSMLGEMDLSNSKDLRSAKVLMQASARMSRRVPGGKLQFMQDFIKKHEMWKNVPFWEEYFWEELAKKHRQKYNEDFTGVDVELVSVLLNNFAFNMLSWGVTLDSTRHFVADMCSRNNIADEQRKKITEGIDLFAQVEKNNDAVITSTPLAENFWNLLNYSRHRKKSSATNIGKSRTVLGSPEVPQPNKE